MERKNNMNMHHVAIMNKSWKLIPKILSGEKSIESRWYQTKRAPWDRISVGDTVFFKNAGEPVVAKATVSGVMQFEIRDIDDAKRLVKKYGKEICLVNLNPATWGKSVRYCILLRLREAKAIGSPFQIDKKGFGSGAAWITVQNIKKIEIPV